MVVENMGFSPSLVCWGYFAFGVILVFFFAFAGGSLFCV
jgi:hypothetical protein